MDSLAGQLGAPSQIPLPGPLLPGPPPLHPAMLSPPESPFHQANAYFCPLPTGAPFVQPTLAFPGVAPAPPLPLNPPPLSVLRAVGAVLPAAVLGAVVFGW